MRSATLSLVAVFVVAAAMIGGAHASVGFTNCSATFLNGYVPSQPAGAVQVCRDGVIAISYDATMVAPAWSAYFITGAEASDLLPGRDDFYPDPDLKALGITQASVDSDAFSTEWNRGHLAPSHLLSHTLDSKAATYTMANVAPQAAYFNQQPWNRLEANVASYIAANKTSLHIVTGVAYYNRANATKSYGIAVPDFYWKAMCDPVGKKSVGFYGFNVPNGNLEGYYQTVDAVEKIYGGSIFSASACNTGTVNPSLWW